MRRGILISASLAIVSIAGAVVGRVPSVAANADIAHYRELLIFDFAASESLISFPVVFAPDTAGLIVINRNSGERKIIVDDSVILRSPYLSRDGKRLLYVERKASSDEQRLVSCATADWRCHIILTTKGTIFSPVELTLRTILYSSSPLNKTNGGHRANYHDLFLLEEGAAPIRLTEFGAYRLSPVSVGRHRVLFSAYHGNGLRGYGGEDELPVRKATNAAVSEIFSLDLADSDDKIVLPDRALTPHFLIPGYSTHAAISSDDLTVAFLNRRNSSDQVHFNLAIADKSEHVIRYIGTKGYGFSTPVFVGQSIVANELLADHYEVKEFTHGEEQSKIVFQLDFSAEALRQVPRISLSFD